ncbi:MAG: hypothetical protein ACTHJ3_05625, partial [Pararhizobium sp.]
DSPPCTPCIPLAETGLVAPRGDYFILFLFTTPYQWALNDSGKYRASVRIRFESSTKDARENSGIQGFF